MHAHALVRMKALCFVLLMNLAHILLINTGVFDGVTAELGYEMYAERVDSIPVLPLPMPLNTLVNFGYFAAGLSWLGTFRHLQDWWGEAFCWYSMVYCFIQLVRIVYQTQRSAVLDQWITTTIFCHVALWITRAPLQHGAWSKQLRCFDYRSVILVSFLSYFLSLTCTVGFEISLAIHMIMAVKVGFEAHQQRGSPLSRDTFIKAMVCCVGFVVLKVADLPFKDYWTPNCLSGHFLSKICDVGQIYFAAKLVFVFNSKDSNMD